MRKFNIILIITIFIIIWIDYIPLKIPSIVENPEKFESLMYNLALAYLASYIFYYINHYLPERKNSKIIKRVIHNNILNIITYRKTLLNLKETGINETTELTLYNKRIPVLEYLSKSQKRLHCDLDSILTIKERLPTELLNYALLLKAHPFFRRSLKDLEKLDSYVDAYDKLSNKLYLEYKKL